jgi:3-dehydroquinate dehydratase/shikimate dehydrogenase
LGFTAEKAAIIGSFGPATNAEAEAAASEGAGLPEVRFVEVRLDAMEQAPDLRVLRACFEGKKLIGTLRSAREGGKFSGSREEERGILASALSAGFDFVDVEFRGGGNADLLGLPPRQVIVSSHTLTGLPADVSGLSSRMKKTGARHVKIVGTAADSRDAVRLLELQAALADGVVTAFGMGEAGIATRVLSPYLGAPLAYGALIPGRATASGQLTARDLSEVYGIPGRRTIRRVFALFGGLVSHSFSPAIHNSNFEARGDDALYVPFALRSLLDEFAPLVAGLQRLGLPLQGASVTIPFKEDAARVGLAEDGSANTLVNAEGVFVASNTDRVALEELIPSAELGDGGNGTEGERALVLGAGGTARTAVEVLRGKGYDVLVHSRNESRARALAEDTGAFEIASSTLASPSSPPSLSSLYSLSKQTLVGPLRVLVNATPLGLKEGDPLPCPPELLRPGLLVVDAPYHPGGTALVRAARDAGADVVDGFTLLLAQAAGQAELFTRRPTTPDDLIQCLPARLKPLFSLSAISGGSRSSFPREVPS